MAGDQGNHWEPIAGTSPPDAVGGYITPRTGGTGDSAGTATELTTVYIAEDSERRVLYVGISGRLSSRMAAHRAGSGWWTAAAKVHFEHFSSRREALAREASLIVTLNPIFNIVGKPKPMPHERENLAERMQRRLLEDEPRIEELAKTIEDQEPLWAANPVYWWFFAYYPRLDRLAGWNRNMPRERRPRSNFHPAYRNTEGWWGRLEAWEKAEQKAFKDRDIEAGKGWLYESIGYEVARDYLYYFMGSDEFRLSESVLKAGFGRKP